MPVQPHRPRENGAHRLSRIERSVGVLEDHLHVAAETHAFVRRQVLDCPARPTNRPRGRRGQPEQKIAQRRLAAAAFADQRERLVLLDPKVDAVHGMHETLRRARKQRSLEREMLGDGVRGENGVHAATAGSA